MCCITGVWATIHTSSWTFLRSLIAQRYAFSSPCAPCVTYFCQFSYQFSLFFIVFVYIEWNKHSLSSPRRGVVPEEWCGPMRKSDDQEIWRNMLEKQVLPNFRPSSQFLLWWLDGKLCRRWSLNPKTQGKVFQFITGERWVSEKLYSKVSSSCLGLWI